MAAQKLKKEISFVQTIISDIMQTIKWSEVLKNKEKAEPLYMIT